MLRRKILIFILSQDMLMDFAGPADVFSHANKQMNCYDIQLISSADNLTGFYGGIDTLLITGNADSPDNDIFFSWLKGEQAKIRRIGFVGVGPNILQKTGLLLDRAYFHTRDGQVYTSGGVSSGVDLALAMVEEDCGKRVASHIASKLVFFYLSRQVYQIEFGNLANSSPLAAQLKEWLRGHLQEPLSVSSLAEKWNMSSRNFGRVFTRQTGLSPAKFIEKIRVDEACKLLVNTDELLEEIASRCGMGGLVSMRRLFLRHLLITPSEYRRILKLSKYENSN